MSNPECYLFAGPTLYLQGRPLPVPPGVRVLPPVRRGDVERLAAGSAPGVMALADGLFHQVLAVGHQEIREALAAGWQVWGLASMGAIRAREMSGMGMRGFGGVYERFARDPDGDFQDDEVTLLHESEAPYRAWTEPMVHLRVALDFLTEQDAISAAAASRVVRGLKERWYGERTLQAFAGALRAEALGDAAVAELLRDFDRYRVKTADLRRFLESRPWET